VWTKTFEPGAKEKLPRLSSNESPSFPSWLKRPIGYSGRQNKVLEQIRAGGLHTVCREAKCPNRSECYSRGVATFLVMGDTCTRDCSFCSVTHGKPAALDPGEPLRVLQAAKELHLRHVVITSVTRDDLSDGGASFFVEIVKLFRDELPEVTIEILVPDFQGKWDSIDRVAGSGLHVFNHNIETVPSLYKKVRPQALYSRSLSVLKRASTHGVVVKSGLMVGLGESESEVLEVMQDLRDNGCTVLTIGQYLRPSPDQTPVVEYVKPEIFEKYSVLGKEMGFVSVFSGPFVRSSYRAGEFFPGI
jgi:lipoic acid synthetase